MDLQGGARQGAARVRRAGDRQGPPRRRVGLRGGGDRRRIPGGRRGAGDDVERTREGSGMSKVSDAERFAQNFKNATLVINDLQAAALAKLMADGKHTGTT